MYIEPNEPDLDDDEGRYGFCQHCQTNVRTVCVDVGIGAYEYWGAQGVHHDWRDVCPSCDGDVSDPKHDEEFEIED
jgi:hypothetical protein